MEAPNETLILDRGTVSLRSVNLMTHADYAAIVTRGLNVLDRNGMLPESNEVEDDDVDTALVPDAEERAAAAAAAAAASQHPRAAGRVDVPTGKTAGRVGGSEC